MKRPFWRFLHKMFGKSPEQIKAEVRREPEVLEARQALDRFYDSVRAAERGILIPVDRLVERRKRPR